jgi:hypothetical protein
MNETAVLIVACAGCPWLDCRGNSWLPNATADNQIVAIHHPCPPGCRCRQLPTTPLFSPFAFLKSSPMENEGTDANF